MIAEQIIIGLWVLAPVVFLLFALWAVLERSAKNKATHPAEHLSAAAFLGVCGIVSYGIHKFVLDWFVTLVDTGLPRNLFLLMVWPMVLFIGAKIIGPTRKIRIEKAPDSSRRGKK